MHLLLTDERSVSIVHWLAEQGWHDNVAVLELPGYYDTLISWVVGQIMHAKFLQVACVWSTMILRMYRSTTAALVS